MANAVNAAGAVDQVKMHFSSQANTRDLSLLSFLIDKPHNEAVCHTPKFLSRAEIVKLGPWPS